MTEITITSEELDAIKDRVGGKLYHMRVVYGRSIFGVSVSEFDMRVVKPPAVGGVILFREHEFTVLKVTEI